MVLTPPKRKIPGSQLNNLGKKPMGLRGSLVDVSWKVHDLLSEYVRIHDKAFKTSIRHAMPIPGIFKAIDFGVLEQEAMALLPKFQNSKAEIDVLLPNYEGAEMQYLELLSEYAEALINTVNHLVVVLSALYAKSQGFVNSNYDWKNYKSDLAQYEKSVKNYQVIGRKLNEFFERIKN